VATRSSDKVDFGKRVRGGLAAPLLRSGVGGHIEHRERGEKQGCRAFGDLSNRQTALMSLCIDNRCRGGDHRLWKIRFSRHKWSVGLFGRYKRYYEPTRVTKTVLPFSNVNYSVQYCSNYCKDPKQADDIFRIHLNGRTARTDRLTFCNTVTKSNSCAKACFCLDPAAGRRAFLARTYHGNSQNCACSKDILRKA
jgi:hypothetical protein